MTRIRYLKGAFPLLVLVLTAATSAQADDYLKLIPGTALAWGAVNHMSAASAKVQKLATVVQAPAASLLDEFKRESGVAKGLDEKGAGGFFVLPIKSETVKIESESVATVMFVAIEDKQEFLGNFRIVKVGDPISEVAPKTEGKPANPALQEIDPEARSSNVMCLCIRNGYAMMTPKRYRAALEAAAASKQDVSAEMAGFESWLADNDGSLVATAAGIKYAADRATAELKKTKDDNSAPPEALAVLRTMMDLYGKALAAAPKEFSLAVAGIRCDQQSSIHVVGRARLVHGGQVSAAFAGVSPVTEKLLTGIPGGPFIFAGGGVGIPKLADGYLDIVESFMKSMKSIYGMSAEDIEKMTKESFAMMKQVHSMNFVMKTAKRGDPIYSNIFSSMRVENSQHILDFQEKYAQSTNQRIQNAKQGMLKSDSVKRLEIGGRPALQQELSFDMATAAPMEASRAVFEEMMGIGGKLVFYHVAADEHTVLMGMGVSQERMKAALDVVKQPRKSLAEDSDVNVTEAMLPADAQWVMYISPRGYMQMTQRIMAVAMKSVPGGEAFTMPDFAKSPPVGISVMATPAELEADIAVPAAIIEAAGNYVKEMQKMIMNRMQQQNPGAARPGPVKPTWISDELAALDESGLRRTLSTREGGQGASIEIQGQSLVNFGANDYLALAADPRLAEAAIAAICGEGLGSGASPLITGHSATHLRLEQRLAEFEGAEAALLFPSGYAANLAAVTALAGPGDVVFADAKNHASLWDGCRLSRADIRAYRHADWQHLDQLLARAQGYRRRLIATDSLFSMDGDLAPLVELAEIAGRYDAMLLVDEAHATGVFGASGRGAAEHLGVEDAVTARVGTLSKALGCAGGFISGSRLLIDWLVNRARPYIYSTAAPAALAAAALAAIEIVVGEPHRRRELLERAGGLRAQLAALGWRLGPSASQIIPVVVGEPQRAVKLSKHLRQRGLLAPAIRPPTVPEGDACLRISLTWGHTEEQAAALVAELGPAS